MKTTTVRSSAIVGGLCPNGHRACLLASCWTSARPPIGGCRVTVVFDVADHNAARAEETIQRLLEPVVQTSSYIVRSPLITAAKTS